MPNLATAIGLDIGHSAVKLAVGGPQGTDLFPAFAIPATHSPADVRASAHADITRDIVAVDGVNYYVGQSALVHSPNLALDDLREGWIETPEHSALMLAAYRRAVALLKANDGEPLVALGLPSRLFQAQAGRLKELAQLTLAVPSERVCVIPQALAAFMSLALADDGQPRTDMPIEDSLWGVMDVGYFTTDFGLLRGGVWSAAGAKSAPGASTMAVEMQTRISAIHGVGLPLLECDAIIRNRSAKIYGKQIDFTAEVGEVVEEFALLLAKQAAQVFQAALPSLDAILLVGGGATAIAPVIRKHLPHIRVNKDVSLRFSVANGLRRYALMMAGE